MESIKKAKACLEKGLLEIEEKEKRILGSRALESIDKILSFHDTPVKFDQSKYKKLASDIKIRETLRKLNFSAGDEQKIILYLFSVDNGSTAYHASVYTGVALPRAYESLKIFRKNNVVEAKGRPAIYSIKGGPIEFLKQRKNKICDDLSSELENLVGYSIQNLT